MTFTFISGTDEVISDFEQGDFFGYEFQKSSESVKTVSIRNSRAIQIQISEPRHFNQMERNALDRAFWRSVTVLDDGIEG